MSITAIQEHQFHNAKRPDGFTLVDFSAVWCPPCKALLPILEELDRELSDVTIVKVDVDESPELASRYGIMSMPTVILFRNGEPVERLVGFRPKDVYKNALAKHSQ